MPRSTLLSIVVVAAAASALPSTADAIRWPWNKDEPWPSSSVRPVVRLAHPTVESKLAASADPRSGERAYRFVAYGDQRALADGEWQEMITRIRGLDEDEGAVAFIVDTGDVVANGRHTDQFAFLAKILEPVRHVPYLVGVGNHEVRNNRAPEAREHSAAFFAYLDPDFGPDRMYYRKDLAPVTFLFLDTNDFVYGETGDRTTCPREIDPRSREAAQVTWIEAQLDAIGDDPVRPTVVVMHHPPVQSSEKHLETARSIWNVSRDGRQLIDLLADGGVDVIVTGHTHTYERFRLVREDGHEIVVVNISGRPRDSVLWFGRGARRARDIRQREDAWLEDHGWLGLDRWDVIQEDVMLKGDESNQFGVFDVESDGRLFLEVHFLAEDEPGGTRRGGRVRIH